MVINWLCLHSLISLYCFEDDLLQSVPTLFFNTFLVVKFMFSRKATKFDKIFSIDLTICSKHQIDGEDFVNSHGLLRKYELYTEDKNV